MDTWHYCSIIKVKLLDGQMVQRHADQIHECASNCHDIGLCEELEDILPTLVAPETS